MLKLFGERWLLLRGGEEIAYYGLDVGGYVGFRLI